MAKSLRPRSEPVQSRAKKQREKILSATSELLKTVGLDDLTTILVAKRVGVSVGTLYHYFPNKHAILFALSELWVEQIKLAIADIESERIDEMQLKPFVNLFINRFAEVYKEKYTLLPLIAVMGSMPELEAINSNYIDHVHSKLSAIVKALPLCLSNEDAGHIAVLSWQLCDSLLFAIYCDRLNEDKSLGDLKYLMMSLLERARNNF